MTANMQESLELAYEAGRKAGMLEVANRQEIILGLCTQLRSYAEKFVAATKVPKALRRSLASLSRLPASGSAA